MDEQLCSWLSALYRAKFYEPCIVQSFSCNNDDSTYLCLDCQLECCSKCFPPHNSHKHIRVLKASRCIGVDVKIMKRFMDISDIRQFIINEHQIVFIKSRQRTPKNYYKNHRVGKCETCCWDISPPSRFCCIECKQIGVERESSVTRIPVMEDMQVNERSETKDSKSRSEADEQQLNKPSCSFRKRSRKAIPFRSPIM